MLDASRAVVVVQKLLNETKAEYVKDIQEEYVEQRSAYYQSQKDKSYISLAKARTKKLKTDWNTINIVKPSFLGTKVFKNYDLKKIVNFIDWDPFF